VAKHVVASVDEIQPGGRKLVEIEGVSIGVFNLGGGFFALRNRCPHQGGPLCEGKLWGLLESPAPGQFKLTRPGEILSCGWHGWEFDVRTGQSWTDPRRLRTRTYQVAVTPGSEIVEDSPSDTDEELTATMGGRVKGPYVAETYPVKTEGAYVVIDLG
jgi:3-phenylpropionate/trans-cinnamate dioxygenase ferredoxin subunit